MNDCLHIESITQKILSFGEVVKLFRRRRGKDKQRGMKGPKDLTALLTKGEAAESNGARTLATGW